MNFLCVSCAWSTSCLSEDSMGIVVLETNWPIPCQEGVERLAILLPFGMGLRQDLLYLSVCWRGSQHDSTCASLSQNTKPYSKRTFQMACGQDGQASPKLHSKSHILHPAVMILQSLLNITSKTRKSPWTSNNFQTSPQIISNLPIFVGVSEAKPQPVGEPSIWAKLVPPNFAKGTNVQTHRGNLCGHRGLWLLGTIPQDGSTSKHRIWWINVSPGVVSQILIISEKRLNHLQIHTGFTVSISSNTLDTHECNTTVRSSTRWRLVMMEWVASTRARISSKSTFTASIAAVKSCPQQWSLVAIPHIRKGANCTKTATKPRDWWQSGVFSVKK